MYAQLCLTLCSPWTIDSQAPLSMEFFRQEYWNRLLSPSLRESSQPKDWTSSFESPALQADSLSLSQWGQQWSCYSMNLITSHLCQNLPSASHLSQSESESHSVVSDSLWPYGLYSPWNSLGQNAGVGSLSLLQGIFLTQGANPGLPYGRQILYQLSHKGSPRILE